MSQPSTVPELGRLSRPGSTMHTDPSNDHKTDSTQDVHDDRKDVHINFEDAEAGIVQDLDYKQEKPDSEWDSDPENPRNWSNGKKWRTTAVVSVYTFVSPLASSMIAPALPQIAGHFKITNPTIAALTLSIYILAYALGPLVLGPLSEIYGRSVVLHVSNIVFVIFNVVSAVAPTDGALIVFRFIAGLGGSAPLAIGAGSIGDMFREENRAAAMAIFSMGPLVGPVVGPVAGGFIAESLGYKWIFGIISIVGGIAGIYGIFTIQETYHPVILERREMKKFLDDEKRGVASVRPHRPALKDVLWVNLTRPVILLTRSFICFMLSLYMSVIYGILYLMFVTFPSLYEDFYGWGPGVSGLSYLGVGIGFLIGVILGGVFVDKIYIRLRDRNGGVGKPEFRIPMMFFGSACLPIGLLWYGWTADKHLNWILPIIGSGIYGLGMITCFLSIQVYMVDSFKYAASAVAAGTVLRSLFGFAFPLFADRIFTSLGVGPGYSLLTGIVILVGVPFPVWIYFKGESLRARDNLAR
ncbi:hypothetical protein FRB94_002546 [Tulasnella sp. JGI-2019a]|nr:hypothetical protein FRB93_010195 [Tulasnella sp. JGI-2019a]KAG9013471.1 hypothetical protein FRB94_002546 [Tulasnella sp. JGI-2019a]